eukprot:7737444-Prorocentrum_lima.AAC.1
MAQPIHATPAPTRGDGAVLYDNRGRHPHRTATNRITIRGPGDAQTAEAHGLACGIRLFLQHAAAGDTA